MGRMLGRAGPFTCDRRGRGRLCVVLGLVVWCLAAPGLASASRTIVSLTFDDGRASQYTMRPLLASHGMNATFYVISNEPDVSTNYLTWQQIHELASDGNEIGGHTLDHYDLTTLDATEAKHQICGDRDALIAHGFSPVSFAYPYGASTPELEQIVAACGYSSARATWGTWTPAPG